MGGWEHLIDVLYASYIYIYIPLLYKRHALVHDVQYMHATVQYGILAKLNVDIIHSLQTGSPKRTSSYGKTCRVFCYRLTLNPFSHKADRRRRVLYMVETTDNLVTS